MAWLHSTLRELSAPWGTPIEAAEGGRLRIPLQQQQQQKQRGGGDEEGGSQNAAAGGPGGGAAGPKSKGLLSKLLSMLRP